MGQGGFQPMAGQMNQMNMGMGMGMGGSMAMGMQTNQPQRPQGMNPFDNLMAGP